jgi:hypothetical protein
MSEGFHRLVTIEASRGLNDWGEFDYERVFLPYLKRVLFDAFDIEPTEDFHPEQISQVLKDEPRSLFCILDSQLIPEPDSQRMRGFTQELHRVLFCGPANPPRISRGRSFEVSLIVVQEKPEREMTFLTGPLFWILRRIMRDRAGVPKTSPVAGTLFRIGSDWACNLRLHSKLVSPFHVEIRVAEDGVKVRDLGSRIGTYVNGKPLLAARNMYHGDLLQVGPLTFAVAIRVTLSVAPPSAKPGHGFYTLEEAAYVLDMSPEKLLAKAQAREVRAFLDKGSWRFRVVDIDELARRTELGSDMELTLTELEVPAVDPSQDIDLSEFQIESTPPSLEDEIVQLPDS